MNIELCECCHEDIERFCECDIRREWDTDYYSGYKGWYEWCFTHERRVD